MHASTVIVLTPLLTHSQSTLVVVIFGLAVPCAMLFYLWSALRDTVGRRDRLREAETPPANFLRGRIALAGVVEVDESDPSSPLVLEVTQAGAQSTHKTKTGTRITNTTWKEAGRKVSARPFLLRLQNGTLVQVEPGERVRFTDTFTSVSATKSGTRTLRAELLPGERTVVHGELVQESRNAIAAGPFRGGTSQRPLLRPPLWQHLEITSTSILPSLERLTKIYRVSLWVSAALFVGLNAFPFRDFYVHGRMDDSAVVAAVFEPFVYGIAAFAFSRIKPWYLKPRVVHHASGPMYSESARNVGVNV